MRRADVEVLALAVASERPVSAWAAAGVLADDPADPRARYRVAWRMRGLAARGLLAKVGNGWAPTEAGRVTMAILMARDPGIEAAFFG